MRYYAILAASLLLAMFGGFWLADVGSGLIWGFACGFVGQRIASFLEG